ncbi:MAG: hypothetical protein ACKVHQ_03290 [Gammaproteobacteria bacterium]
MSVIKPTLLFIIVSTLSMSSVIAQDLNADERAERREQFQNMTEEERTAAREARRENFQNLTDEERSAAREARREQRNERFESLSDEERQVIQERRQQRQASGEGVRGRGPARGPGGGERRGN